MSIWTLIGQIFGNVSDAVINFNPRVNVGLAVKSIVRITAGRVNAGFAVVDAFASHLRTKVNVGFSVKSYISGIVRAFVNVGFTVRSLLRLKPEVNTGVSADEVVVSLVRHVGANSVIGLGEDSWPNQGNARFLSDGQVASCRGSLTESRSYRLSFAYADPVNKDLLVIKSVKALIYYNHLSTLGNSSRTFVFAWPGNIQSFGPVTAANNALATPEEINLFSLGLTSWSDISSLTAEARCTTNMAAPTSGMDLDAIELVIEAEQII